MYTSCVKVNRWVLLCSGEHMDRNVLRLMHGPNVNSEYMDLTALR